VGLRGGRVISTDLLKGQNEGRSEGLRTKLPSKVTCGGQPNRGDPAPGGEWAGFRNDQGKNLAISRTCEGKRLKKKKSNAKKKNGSV